jgi:hypothetical protein
MKTFPLELTEHDDAPAALDSAAAQLGLSSKRFTLASLPGATHWHFRMPGQKGTLEATYNPGTSEAWLSVHENRQGDWIETAIAAIQRLVSPSSSMAP